MPLLPRLAYLASPVLSGGLTVVGEQPIGELGFYVGSGELQKRRSRMELNASRSELYRQRALEVRQTAARIEHPDVKEEYEKIAREYDALAKALDLGLLAR